MWGFFFFFLNKSRYVWQLTESERRNLSLNNLFWGIATCCKVQWLQQQARQSLLLVYWLVVMLCHQELIYQTTRLIMLWTVAGCSRGCQSLNPLIFPCLHTACPYKLPEAYLMWVWQAAGYLPNKFSSALREGLWVLRKRSLLPCKKNNHFLCVLFWITHNVPLTISCVDLNFWSCQVTSMCSFYSLSDTVLPPGVWLSGLDSFPVSCPSYLAQLSELAEFAAPADGSATAGAFRKKVGGACCSCFRCDQDVIFDDIEMRQCNAKDPGLNLKKGERWKYFFEKNVPHMAADWLIGLIIYWPGQLRLFCDSKPLFSQGFVSVIILIWRILNCPKQYIDLKWE